MPEGYCHGKTESEICWRSMTRELETRPVVQAIHIAPASRLPMQAVESVVAAVTATPVPPTATPTPVPPTATATPVPPTETPAPAPPAGFQQHVDAASGVYLWLPEGWIAVEPVPEPPQDSCPHLPHHW